MRHLIVLAIIILFGVNGFGQSQFQKIYKPTSSSIQSFLQCARQTSDGGFIMAGWEDAMGVPLLRANIFKTDDQGVVTWSKRYNKNISTWPLPDQEDPVGMCMMNFVSQNSDGTYITAGSYNGDAFIMKLTSAGAVSWAKLFAGNDGSAINCVKQTGDGNFIATGYTYSNDTKDSANLYILKLTSAGAYSWDKIYRFSTVGDDIGYGIAETSDGYVVVGSTEQINGTDTTTDAIMLKTSKTGTLLWCGTRGDNAESEDAYSVKLASDGNLFVSGATTSTGGGGDAFIWKVSNSSGDIQWGKAIDAGLGDIGFSVDEKNGYCYVFGFNVGLLSFNFMEMFVSKLTNDGNTLNQTWLYGSTIEPYLMVNSNSSQVTSDDGFLLCGLTQSISAGGQNGILIKTGSSGYTGCNEQTYSAGFQVYSPHTEGVTPTDVGPTSVSNINMLAINLTSDVVTICQIQPLLANAGTNSNVCQGSAFTLGGSPTATGGTSPYTYAWSSSPAGFTSAAANPSVTVTATTTYTVTVTDQSAQTATSSVTLTPISLPSANAGNDATICQGQSTQLNATGGGTYAWSPSGSLNNAAIYNPIATPSGTTTYTVTVTGGNGCTNTDNVLVTVNSAPVVNVSNTGPYCQGNTIQLSASGGSLYSWNGPGGYSGTGANPSIPSATPAMSGTYTVIVTGANTCTASGTTTVTVNPNPNATATSDSPFCVGETITLYGGGGTGYAWSGPQSFSSTSQNPTISNATTNMAGTYTVTVSDVNSCTSSASVTITVNVSPTANAGPDQSIAYGSFTSLTGSGTGGSGSYTFSWTPTDSLVNAGIQNPQTVNLEATTIFTLVVTDASTGCTGTDQVTITIIGGPLSTNPTATPASICAGQNVQLDAVAGGGSGSYTYSWTSSPAGFTSTLANPTVNPLVTTTYYVTVNDGFNQVNGSVTVTVNPLPTASATYTGPYCAGETISLSSSGGDSYSWTGPLSFASADQNPTIANSTISMSGTYTVEVTDANGCTDDATVSVVVNAIPNADAGSNTAVCYGDSVQLTASGGNSFVWSPAGTLSSSSIYNPYASPLVGTMYYVTVTNDLGCTNVDSVYVDVRPLPSTFVISGGGQFCPGGSGVAITLSGSESGVNYTLYNGTTLSGQLPGTGSPLNFNATAAGTYTVVAVDAMAGCTVTMTGTVSVSTYPQPDLNATVTDVNCFGDGDGSITVSVTSGSPPYNFDWSHDGTNHSQTATSLTNGNYTITVTDNNGCTDTYTASVIQPAALTVACTSGNTSCYGAADGTATATPSGGTAPYLYNWINGANSSIINGLSTGSYSVTVTDNHGCTAVSSTIVGQPSPILIDDSLVNVSCFGANDGLIALEMTGGSEPFSYLWSNGSILPDLFPVAAGQYVVTVTDNNGCWVTDTFTLTQPGEIYVTVTSGVGTDHLGYAEAVSSGGSGTHSYNWSNGSLLPEINGLNSGTYILTITDLAGCSVYDTVVIDIPVVIPNAITPNADGKNDDFEILGVGSFPHLTIEIYTRWGKRVFLFEGTGMEYVQPSNRWNGVYEGKNLPMGSYQYIIHLEGYSEPFTGQVLLVY